MDIFWYLVFLQIYNLFYAQILIKKLNVNGIMYSPRLPTKGSIICRLVSYLGLRQKAKL